MGRLPAGGPYRPDPRQDTGQRIGPDGSPSTDDHLDLRVADAGRPVRRLLDLLSIHPWLARSFAGQPGPPRPRGWGTTPSLCRPQTHGRESGDAARHLLFLCQQESIVDTSGSDPWAPESAASLPAPVGVYQGTISRLRRDQPGSCGNSEDLAPCGPDATPGTPVRRTQARAGCGNTGSDDGGLRIARTGSPSGLVITGDIDEFTYLRLTAAVAGLADGDGTATWPGSGPLSTSVRATMTGRITRAGGSSCTACQRTSRLCSRSWAGTQCPAGPSGRPGQNAILIRAPAVLSGHARPAVQRDVAGPHGVNAPQL